MTCGQIRASAVEAWPSANPPGADVSAHLEACPECRAWFAAFREGTELAGAEGNALRARVLARTSGGACSRARELIAGQLEEPAGELDRALLAEHLEHCPACAELAQALDAVGTLLPSLGTLDPGPGFADRVLAQTSRRPARPTAAERWREAWGRLVRRPRFAWEVAYVATICWVVFFGPSVSAIEWTTAKVTTVARERVPSGLDAIGQTIGEWRAAVAAGFDAVQSGAAEPQGESTWLGSAVSSVMASVAWVRQTAVWILDGLESVVQGVVAWAGDLFGRLTADTTEPQAATARSPE